MNGIRTGDLDDEQSSTHPAVIRRRSSAEDVARILRVEPHGEQSLTQPTLRKRRSSADEVARILRDDLGGEQSSTYPGASIQSAPLVPTSTFYADKHSIQHKYSNLEPVSTSLGNLQPMSKVAEHPISLSSYAPLYSNPPSASETVSYRETSPPCTPIPVSKHVPLQKPFLEGNTQENTKEKLPKCNFCGLKFRKKSAMEIHRRLHALELPHKCPQCPAKFMHRNDLNAHLKIHRAEIQFQCTECPARFTQKSNLETHLTTHTEKNPHDSYPFGAQ